MTSAATGAAASTGRHSGDGDSEVAVEIRGLTKTFGSTKALRDVNLVVRPGECHALLGRNGAGKSTLIGILTGLVEGDGGQMRVFGTEVTSQTSGNNVEDLVACVYQKSTLVPGLTVAENITLGDYPRTRLGGVSWSQINRKAVEQLSEWGHGNLAQRVVSDLEPVERKIVEICRALARGPRVLLLDEPTAGLDAGSVDELFRQVGRLKERGVTVIYVSHHLEEIFQICDRVTVLRDGRDVMSKAIGELTMDDIISAMTGGDSGASPVLDVDWSTRTLGAVQLEIDDLRVGDRVDAFDLRLQAGELVGLTGLDGAGHVQVAEAIAGQVTVASGEIRHAGRPLASRRPLAAIKAGIGFVPEDRHTNGYVPQLSVEENATLTVLHRIRTRVGLLDRHQRRASFARQASAWSIVCSGPDQVVEELSGGNQQKVVLARALASDPDTVVVINPTAGVDIAAKNSIYRTLIGLAAEGKALIVVSSDDDDLRICDRIIAMRSGRPAGELARGYADDDLIRLVQGATAGGAGDHRVPQE